jgi:hypothetical protein
VQRAWAPVQPLSEGAVVRARDVWQRRGSDAIPYSARKRENARGRRDPFLVLSPHRRRCARTMPTRALVLPYRTKGQAWAVTENHARRFSAAGDATASCRGTRSA